MWVKIDDQMPDHPKIKSVGPLGFALQAAAICYCARYLTDGVLSFAAADSVIASVFAPYTSSLPDDNGKYRIMTAAVTSGMGGEDADEVEWKSVMVSAGLWDQMEGGFFVHDYDKYNPTKREVMKARKTNYSRLKRWRARQETPLETPLQTHLVTLPPSPSPSPSPSFTNQPPHTPPSGGVSKGFEPFWTLYPRKVGKGAALKAWTRLHPTNGQCEAIYTAVRAQLRTEQWTKNNGQFIPHPATWLNQRRWEDEVPDGIPDAPHRGCPSCGWDLGHAPSCRIRT